MNTGTFCSRDRKLRCVVSSVLAIVFAAGFVFAQSAEQPTTLTKPRTASVKLGSDGFIKRWLVLEPVETRGLTDSAVRSAIHRENMEDQLTTVPQDGERVSAGGNSLVWHAVDTEKYNVNLFHFARALNKKTSDVLFWAVTVVHATGDRRNVRLAIGSNAASVWWLNGSEVASVFGDRQTVVDDGVSKRLTLHKGANVLRAAIVNGGGATDFCARFLDENDKPMTNLIVTLSKDDLPRGTASPK